jgi:branched-chain amino acid transport system ATP-binding protein
VLKVQNLTAGYGGSTAVRNVGLQVNAGEVLVLVGRNGSGRSTLAKALMGLLPSTGEIHLDTADVSAWPTHRRALAGMGYVPETRDVFGHLSVQDNLRMGAQGVRFGRTAYWSAEEAYRRFPLLRERKHTDAGVLSGGEQQLLALARTLMGQPSCVVLDEPLEGLSPFMVEAIVGCIGFLKTHGVAVLLIEQKLNLLPHGVVDRVMVLGQGMVVFEGTVSALGASPQVRRQWLEV